jgi:hypothetical protein
VNRRPGEVSGLGQKKRADELGFTAKNKGAEAAHFGAAHNHDLDTRYRCDGARDMETDWRHTRVGTGRRLFRMGKWSLACRFFTIDTGRRQ